MDLRKLKTMIDLVSESNVTELEVTEAEGKVRIVKGHAGAAFVPAYAPVPVMPAPAAAGLVAQANTDAASAAETPSAVPAGKLVKSPMVGTFYRAASPEAKVFVEVGSTVQLGQTVCIVEAMKILNEIQAEVAGTVREILVQNGQAVEYGQPLFVLE